MATPFVAGAAALILQKHGKGKANGLGVRGLLESTAHSTPSTRNSTYPLQSLAQAGAGLLNVYKAVHGKTLVTPCKPRMAHCEIPHLGWEVTDSRPRSRFCTQ